MVKGGKGWSRRLRPIPLVAATAIFLLVSTVVPPKPHTMQAAPNAPQVCRGGTLKVTYRDDPNIFDPALSALTVVRFFSVLLYDTLFEYQEPELKVIPRLAESWEQPNPTTLVIRIRRGVRFHNGLGMRAEDVKFTLDRVRDPKGGSQWTGLLSDIDRIVTVDPWTIRILLKQPSAPLLGYLAHHSTSIVPKAYVESGGDLKTQPVGTGAFQFVKREGSNIFVTRNKHYYRQGLPYVDNIVWSIIPDVNSTGAALRAGAVDIALKVGPEIVPLFQRLKDFQVIGGLTGSFNPLTFNVNDKPLDDWRVRQAIAWAVDRDQVLKVSRGELGTVLPSGPIPGSHWAALKQPIFKQDYNKARQLLQEAGQTQGFRWTVTIWSAFPTHVRAIEAIREQLRPLNIETNIELRDQATFFDLWTSKKISTILGWAGLIDPDEFSERFRSTSGVNRQNFADPRVDELIARGRRELDQGKRAEIYAQLQRLLGELSPAVFLYADHVYTVANSKVKGIKHVFTENHTYLREVWLEGCR